MKMNNRSMKCGVGSMNLFFVLIVIFLTSYFLLPTPAQAQTPYQTPTPYRLLAPIPLGGTTQAEETTTEKYLPGLIKMVIGLAGVLAVLRLMYAGIKYMSTDAFSEKTEAKGIIEDALWGLALAMSAWLILNTLNPKLVNLDLSIKPQEIKTPSTGGGGGDVGCQGTCPRSYVNGGDTINYKDCSSCSDADSFELTIKQETINGEKAKINTALGNSLKSVSVMPGNPTFQVTETWPPTVNHANQKQYEGTSVDISLFDKTGANITAFIRNAASKGLTAVYEVKTEDERNTYIRQGVPAVSIITVPRISGEHFSVPPK